MSCAITLGSTHHPARRPDGALNGKRLFDLCLVVPALLLLAPILLVLGVLVRLDSPGPALFRQIRVGRDGRLFEILKFRSMVADAGKRGLKITAGRDPRITRIGSMLRASKLDELPQLLNVLRGEMSLVGPRPEVPQYVLRYPTEMRETVLSVAPGITDIASVFYRSESDLLGRTNDPEAVYLAEILPIKLRLAEHYVRRCSILTDVRVIFATLAAVALGHAPGWLLPMPAFAAFAGEARSVATDTAREAEPAPSLAMAA